MLKNLSEIFEIIFIQTDLKHAAIVHNDLRILLDAACIDQSSRSSAKSIYHDKERCSRAALSTISISTCGPHVYRCRPSASEPLCH